MTSKRPEGTCKDCWAAWCIAHDAWVAAHFDNPEAPEPKLPKRPAPWPGPRCMTCHRAEDKKRKTRAHARRTETNFGIPADLYWALYEFQGGKCAVLHCRATGKTKALAVDHDHKCCPGRTSCGKCVRGLLCGPHNEMFGRNGDDPAVFRDMADYLELSTMDRFRMRARVAEAYGLAEAMLGAHLPQMCPDDCEYRHIRHAHGAVMYEPSERGPQAEQGDGDTGPGSVEQEAGTVGADGPDTGAVRPIRWQGIRPVRDDEV